MEQNLKEKTGKDLGEWKKVLAAKKFTKHGEIMTFLKKDQGITHGFANFISLKFRGTDAGSMDDASLVEAQYKGKEHLKPIYDAIQAFATKLGDDVEVAPKKAAVSFRRKRQFALVQPSTKKRVDLGLKFNDRAHAGRLETSGPFGAMCTHRVQLTDVSDVDDEVLGWVREAFEEA